MSALLSLDKAIQEFMEAMSTAGVPFDGVIDDDGLLHRFQIVGDKKGTKKGWYVFHSDNIPSGAFGSWNGETKQTWCSQTPSTMSDEERRLLKSRVAAAKASRQAEIDRQYNESATHADLLLTKSIPASDSHPYLTRKKCCSHDVTVTTEVIKWQSSTSDYTQTIPENSLVIPMFNEDGFLRSLQFIYARKPDINRDKTFLAGGETRGTYFPIGVPASIIYICEGYATGATIHELTQEAVAVAFTAGNLINVGKFMRHKFPQKRIVFVADNDAWSAGKVKNPGVTQAKRAASEVLGEVIIPGFADITTKPTDMNDLFLLEGAEVAKKQLSFDPNNRNDAIDDKPDQYWPNISGVALKVDNTPYPHLQNAYAILRNDARWKDKIAFNIFSNDIEAIGDLPFTGGKIGSWSDDYDSRASVWLSDRCGLRLNTKTVKEAIHMVAKDNPIHPVREYLNGLDWDGEERLSYWLSDYAGVIATKFSNEIAKRWMISAVARILSEIAVKVDTAIILEGVQGLKKSSLLKVLGGKWFMDTPFDIGSKDGYMVIQGKWIIEMAELDSMSKSTASRSKAFFSAAEDTYRAPYSSRVDTYPRQCVFAGTVNHSEYLDDETGNRRTWPVECLKIDIEGLTKVRDQLWAEAVHYYRDGEQWWITDEEINKEAVGEQDSRQKYDVWETFISAYLIGKTEVRIEDLLCNAVNISKDKIEPRDQMRVGKCMTKLGWKKYRVRDGGYVHRDPNALI